MKNWKLSLVTSLLLGAMGACATDPVLDGREQVDPTGEVEDVEAKADGLTSMVGLYQLVNPDVFDEGQPRTTDLDLRSDGTFYERYIGPVDNNGNFEEGWGDARGTYKKVLDSHGNTYLRFTTANGTWREKFKASGTTLNFYYRTGELGFSMKRAAHPAAAFIAKIKSSIGTVAKTMINDNDVYKAPYAAADHYYDLRDTVQGLKMSSTTLDGKKLFLLQYNGTGGTFSEVYAANGQLLARTAASDATKWDAIKP
jgi:hypothetical protein